MPFTDTHYQQQFKSQTNVATYLMCTTFILMTTNSSPDSANTFQRKIIATWNSNCRIVSIYPTPMGSG